MNYKIEFKPSALKAFKKLNRQTQKRIAKKIDLLENDPLPLGVVKLKGSNNCYRLKVGDYRIIYNIEKDRLLVLVLKIGDRKDVYKTK